MRINDEVFVLAKGKTIRGHVESLTDDGELVEVAFRKKNFFGKEKMEKKLFPLRMVKKVVYGKEDSELQTTREDFSHGEFYDFNTNLEYLSEFLEEKYKEKKEKLGRYIYSNDFNFSVRFYGGGSLRLDINLDGLQTEFRETSFADLTKNIRAFLNTHSYFEKQKKRT